jgi:2-oxoisovalerate dehydrogenase E1 component alpha subunit
MPIGALQAPPEIHSGDDALPTDLCLKLHRLLVRARALEERSIKMSKSGEGLFWVGGPGEEAFTVSLGLQVNKGQGAAYDFLHLHSLRA